ncbi:MAG: transcriptional regulator [Deltaproteobacteria bacterium]|nr:transcriptional regulator [Deltaproteobacteria bacterium]
MPEPAPRDKTIRESIRQLLADGAARTLRELSQEIGVSEKVLPHHLEHLERSLRREGRRLVLEPPQCLDCDFAFPERTRFRKPGRCPKCRGTHLSPPEVYLPPAGT